MTHSKGPRTMSHDDASFGALARRLTDMSAGAHWQMRTTPRSTGQASTNHHILAAGFRKSVNLADDVRAIVSRSGIAGGIALLHTPRTTCGVVIYAQGSAFVIDFASLPDLLPACTPPAPGGHLRVCPAPRHLLRRGSRGTAPSARLALRLGACRTRPGGGRSRPRARPAVAPFWRLTGG